MILSIIIPNEMAPRIQLLREYLENDNSVIHECQVCGERHPHKNKEKISLDTIASDALDREAQRLIKLGNVWEVAPRRKPWWLQNETDVFTPADIKDMDDVNDILNNEFNSRDASVDPASDPQKNNLLQRCRGCLTFFPPTRANQIYHDAKCRHRLHARNSYRRKHDLPLV